MLQLAHLSISLPKLVTHPTTTTTTLCISNTTAQPHANHHASLAVHQTQLLTVHAQCKLLGRSGPAAPRPCSHDIVIIGIIVGIIDLVAVS